MNFESERCVGCSEDTCPVLVRERLKDQADGQRIIAANWFRLRDYYREKGKDDLAKIYGSVANLDLARAKILDEEALQVEMDLCPIQPRGNQ